MIYMFIYTIGTDTRDRHIKVEKKDCCPPTPYTLMIVGLYNVCIQERSHTLTSGSTNPDDFDKISDKLLFVMKPTLITQ
jgi:hypothetical protein